LKKNSSWGFGTEKRHGPESKTHQLPGPGNYNLDSKAFDYKKPKFHLG
jgi:Sperm-tail PG-rich repeat